MSWIKRRPLLAIGALALILRVGSAVVTEYRPIFPAYYYTDANNIRAAATSALGDTAAGRKPLINGTLAERIQTLVTLRVFQLFGRRSLPIKLLNALLGAAGVASLIWSLSLIFPAEAALAAGFITAVWPSHVFYTSQNLKEAPADLLAYLALGTALASGLSDARWFRASALAFASALALTGAGFYRSYVMVCLVAALLFTLLLTARKKACRINALSTTAALLTALSFYPLVAGRVLVSFRSTQLGSIDTDRNAARLFPVTYDETNPGRIDRPTSPEGITRFRTSRQSADRNWARANGHRVIATQIYPEMEFRTWLDVLAYLPKGAFTVLFQPLPGLYPLDGKIGRYAAAAENTILLALATLAAAGFLHGPKTPGRLGVLAFFTAMTVGAALLEFDLGSAGRHKLLYLPMLFPFAAEEIFRLLGRKEPT